MGGGPKAKRSDREGNRRRRPYPARFPPERKALPGPRHAASEPSVQICQPIYNIKLSLFFLTDLVIRQGHLYTFYSLFFLALVQIGFLLPIGLLHRLWYYSVLLAGASAGIHFLVVSV